MTDPALNIKPERLSMLLKVGLRLASERDIERLLLMIIEETTTVMDAERSSLFLIEREKNEMWAKIAQGAEIHEIRFPLGVGIAGAVGKTGEIINIPDAYRDSRFNPEFDKKTGFRTRSILCVPMKNLHGEILGAIQVLNKHHGLFDADDATLLTALAAQAAVTIENADLCRKLNEFNVSLERKVEERTVELTRANTRLSVLNKELEELSITDGLTNVFNRRYFIERLRQEMKRVSRYGPPASLLMIDIDHFKKVNDAYGHQAGDAVLAGVAGILSRNVRETDVIGRYGGEEFAVMLPATDVAGTQVLAERLRTIIAGSVHGYGGERLTVTVSIGVSTWQPAVKDDFEELIRLADAALYRAKEQGRNRVCS